MPPPRTPTAILKLRGSWLARHRKDDALPTIGEPAVPKWLDQAERAHWKHVVSVLPPGVLTVADGDVLGYYCRVCTWLQESETPGERKLYLSEFRGLSDRLGLSPSARSRIHIGPAAKKAASGDDDDPERFFNAG